MIRVRFVSALLALAVVGVVPLASGCRGQTSKQPQIVPIRNMFNQPRYDPQQRSTFFPDHRVDRRPVPGTVAREDEPDLNVLTGRKKDGSGWVLEIPAEVIDRHGGMAGLEARGQTRFNIYCAPCHGFSGYGDGMVARRAVALGVSVLKPPSFHDDRIRHMPDGQMFATMSNGIRNMPPYRQVLPVDDRWAIVSYVRALEISQGGRKTAMNTVEVRP